MNGLGRALLFFLLISKAVEAGAQVENLSPEHRRWLEQEVVYIITDREKEFFLSLETLEEREGFIAAFWRRRDPNPATPANEFKDEHYRRIDFANRILGRETVQPGWTTERGRYYIILGEPRSVERFVGKAEVVTCELWTYQGPRGTRLPPFFYLLFYKRFDSEDYRLYSPVGDGPSKLILGERGGLQSDTEKALRILSDVSYELAYASLSLDLGEPPDFVSAQPSLVSDFILGQAADAAKYPVRTDYIDSYLRYGKRVSADYSFNFVPSRSTFALLIGPEGSPFVSYSIELDPQNFTVATDEDKSRYYTTLDVSLEVRSSDGVPIYVDEKVAYVELSPGQFDQLGVYPFAYQDGFPLVPGDYRVAVILRNRLLKQYTVVDLELKVPSYSMNTAGLGDIILGYEMELSGESVPPDEIRTFQIGAHRIYPAADNAFSIGDTAHVLVQTLGALPGMNLKLSLLSGEKVLQERVVAVENFGEGPVFETLDLSNMVGGRYPLRAELIAPDGIVLAEKTSLLQLSPRTFIPRPWIHSHDFDSAVPGLLALTRGRQFLAWKRYEEAERELEKAIEDNPDLPQARWRLAGIYIGRREPDRALELLLPLEETHSSQYEVIAGLGFANHLKGDFANAATYLEQALAIRPPGTSLLNALADCHLRLGAPDKARSYLERSLELNPGQERIKELLSSLKESSK